MVCGPHGRRWVSSERQGRSAERERGLGGPAAAWWAASHRETRWCSAGADGTVSVATRAAGNGPGTECQWGRGRAESAVACGSLPTAGRLRGASGGSRSLCLVSGVYTKCVRAVFRLAVFGITGKALFRRPRQLITPHLRCIAHASSGLPGLLRMADSRRCFSRAGATVRLSRLAYGMCPRNTLGQHSGCGARAGRYRS